MTPPDIAILARDEHVVAIAKPPGLLVHRTRESRDRVFLLQQAAALCDAYLYPVHRLDRATSGAILFALTPESARAFHEQLQHPETRKEYLALVRGDTPDAFVSERPLSGKPAHTEFTTLARFARCSLLRVRTRSGRRHQIRRHLSHLAHQVIGDTSHGKGKINRALRAEYDLPRLCLHADRLTMTHPLTGAPFVVHAPLHDDLRAFFLRLPDAPTELIAAL